MSGARIRCFVLSLAALVCWQGRCRAAEDVLTFVISNEAPGYLIDRLIASGHGEDRLYQVLQLLAAQPDSGIPADFVAEVGASPPGSDVFTAWLYYFAINYPVCINADGTVSIKPIYGRDYFDHDGFTNRTIMLDGAGTALCTTTADPSKFIDAGHSGGTGDIDVHYRAFGVAWGGSAKGDLNRDGLVNGVDYGMLCAYLCGSTTRLDDPSDADMNGDGLVRGDDAVLLKRTAVLAGG